MNSKQRLWDQRVIEKLSTLFLQDNTRPYLALKDCYNYQHSFGQNFSDLIVEFEKLYHKISTHDMILLEAAKALLFS